MSADILRDLARAKVAFQLRAIETVIRGPAYDPARMERCEYCQCSRHSCGCEERFEYEAIRDNPTLLAR